MIEQTKNQYTPSEVSPPGETLREILDERGMSQAELATRMGRPKKTINEVINAKAAITPDTALELELVLGIPADFWNARERDYRASLARREQDRRLAEAIAWCQKFPLREMKRLGWIESTTSIECARALLEFFAVTSPQQWDEVYSKHSVAFRCSRAFEVDRYALTAWLRKGVLEAEATPTGPFEADRFSAVLKDARALTFESPSVFVPQLRQRCAEAGVAVSFVPELPRSRVSGATRWVSPSKALIQLSLRYRTDDHLWFTFFHESAHILFHGRDSVFLELGSQGGVREQAEETEADRWAGDFLIPENQLRLFLARGRVSTDDVRAFASKLGIAAGIVVGRLQHDGAVPHSHFNKLKRRFEWASESR